VRDGDRFIFNPSKYLQLQTTIDHKSDLSYGTEDILHKELNLRKLSELCGLPENDTNVLVFTLVKTIGYFSK